MLGNLFGGKKETLEFRVKGMTCQGCVKTISNFLKNQKGISSVDLNLETGTAKIEVNAKLWNTEKLKELIKQIGYEFE